MRSLPCRFGFPVLIAALSLLASPADARSGKLTLHVVDAESGAPLAGRMQLKNKRGRVRKVPRLPFYNDHFSFRSPLQLTLPEGNYTFEIECGPEYHTRTGHFTIERTGTDTKTLKMKRFGDMSAEGWWAGDLYVDRPLRDMDLLMQAEDLHLAQVVAWSDKKNELPRARKEAAKLTGGHAERQFSPYAGRDTRTRGGLAFFPTARENEPLKNEGALPLADSQDRYPTAALWAAEDPVVAHVDCRAVARLLLRTAAGGDDACCAPWWRPWQPRPLLWIALCWWGAPRVSPRCASCCRSCGAARTARRSTACASTRRARSSRARATRAPCTCLR